MLDRASSDVVDLTVIADGSNAGEKLHASEVALPPATATVTPEFTAASSASAMACWVPDPPKVMDATAGFVGVTANQSKA